MVLGKNTKGRRLLEFCDEKELCVVNTWFYKAGKRKITYSAAGCETEIDLALVREKYKKECKSDSMGTSAQAGGCRSGQKDSKKGKKRIV